MLSLDERLNKAEEMIKKLENYLELNGDVAILKAIMGVS